MRDVSVFVDGAVAAQDIDGGIPIRRVAMAEHVHDKQVVGAGSLPLFTHRMAQILARQRVGAERHRVVAQAAECLTQVVGQSQRHRQVVKRRL